MFDTKVDGNFYLTILRINYKDIFIIPVAER